MNPVEERERERKNPGLLRKDLPCVLSSADNTQRNNHGPPRAKVVPILQKENTKHRKESRPGPRKVAVNYCPW